MPDIQVPKFFVLSDLYPLPPDLAGSELGEGLSVSQGPSTLSPRLSLVPKKVMRSPGL